MGHPATNRRRLVLLLLVGVAAVGLVVAGLTWVGRDGQSSVGVAGSGRPNIVLVTTDDMSLTDLAYMPATLELLGGQGATFESFLSNHPLCCPARAQILTGQHAQSNKVFDNTGRFGGFKALRNPEENIGAWLREAGYETAFIGKFLNLWERRPTMQAGWTIFNPIMKGTYAPFDLTMFNHGEPQKYPDVYTADLMGELTVDAIEQFAGQGAPFFIWTSQLPPHGMHVNRRWVPPVPAERHRDAYPDAMPPAWGQPVFHEEDVSDKPPWVRETVRASPEKMVRLHRERVRSLLSVDEQVRATVEALDRVGQLDNTYIFFTSDNGYAVGEHGLTTKNHPYETSLRIPLLVRGPGIPPGVARPGQFGLADLSPTFLDIADADPGRRQDGRSMLPALTDGDDGYSHYLIQASGWSYVPGLKWWWRGVRSPDYTYVRYHDGFEELYDLRADPTQLDNIVDDPGAASVRDDMRGRLSVLENCRGAACQQGGQQEDFPQG